MSNVLAAGTHIIDRLRDQLTTLASVRWGSAFAGPNAESIRLPAAFVQPSDANGSDDTDESDVTREVQRWQVGLRVELDPGSVEAYAPEVELGELIYQAIVALRGWRPVVGVAKLIYTGRTEVQYPPGVGVAEVWLGFETTTVTRRT